MELVAGGRRVRMEWSQVAVEEVKVDLVSAEGMMSVDARKRPEQ